MCGQCDIFNNYNIQVTKQIVIVIVKTPSLPCLNLVNIVFQHSNCRHEYRQGDWLYISLWWSLVVSYKWLTIFPIERYSTIDIHNIYILLHFRLLKVRPCNRWDWGPTNNLVILATMDRGSMLMQGSHFDKMEYEL